MDKATCEMLEKIRARVEETEGLTETDTVDTEMNALADLVEEAGFEVPEDMDDVEEFLDAVERDVLEDADLDKELGATIKDAVAKARGAVEKLRR